MEALSAAFSRAVSTIVSDDGSLGTVFRRFHSRGVNKTGRRFSFGCLVVHGNPELSFDHHSVELDGCERALVPHSEEAHSRGQPGFSLDALAPGEIV